MALPVRAYRKDIALMVAFNPAQPSQFTTFCGATSVSFSLTNEIQTERVADCDDLTAAVQTIKEYGAESWRDASSTRGRRIAVRDDPWSRTPEIDRRTPRGCPRKS